MVLQRNLEKLQSAMDIKPIMRLLIILSQWQKSHKSKAEAIFSYMQECDLIIIDDVFMWNQPGQNCRFSTRAVTFLNETRSIIFITNRELSAWIDAAEDKHL